MRECVCVPFGIFNERLHTTALTTRFGRDVRREPMRGILLLICNVCTKNIQFSHAFQIFQFSLKRAPSFQICTQTHTSFNRSLLWSWQIYFFRMDFVPFVFCSPHVFTDSVIGSIDYLHFTTLSFYRITILFR